MAYVPAFHPFPGIVSCGWMGCLACFSYGCLLHSRDSPFSMSKRTSFLSASSTRYYSYSYSFLSHRNLNQIVNCGFCSDVSHHLFSKPETNFRPPPPAAQPEEAGGGSESLENNGHNYGEQIQIGAKAEMRDEDQVTRMAAVLEANIHDGSFAIISACGIGLLTGVCVVLFNYAVHEIRDFFWDGIPYRGASWLREEPFEVTWKRTILVPVCGGLLVGILNVLREALEGPTSGVLVNHLKGVLQPLLKSLAACITLGTGNSLGPEGPSVEIGSSIAKGIGALFDKGAKRKVSLVAAGSAAGISSGFYAAVAGCFFAVESVLWPSSAESSASVTNTTSMVILSAVIASVLSQVGLGSEPAFKVPDYDFCSPSELPLYLLLGILCGLVSLVFSRCTSYMLRTAKKFHKVVGVPRAVFPVIGSFSVGMIALAYPEILYWGFENVDILLESRPFVEGLSADILLQLVAVKIVATSLCRASGLVGGYYAPSLFIGAATGMAYGKFISLAVSQSYPIFHISFFEVASPQAYGLVGMAATLAGVCQVPLTSVLLLFELTQDYRIVLPLLGAVGFSSWITSSRTRRMDSANPKKINETAYINEQIDTPTLNSGSLLSRAEAYNANDLCEAESSLCLDDSDPKDEYLERRIFVSQAMRTRYATVLESTLLIDAVTLMLAEKQSYALIVNNDNLLIGLLSLEDIQQFSRSYRARSRRDEELLVADICSLDGEKCGVLGTVTPSMDLLSADIIMTRYSLSQLPVVSEHGGDNRGHPVGIIDRECIRLACKAVATRESLNQNFRSEMHGPE
ncbi:hypothetical protein Nepgr_011525 [Nepenthes gracilis]|uniref:Chloride channel protein n=1 Tax=Nepenthes gracilis TaxID=150966 RepID=A0AAD3SF05_NEPGR|nr:hypothetical protein Nepgr_011525 [Nepenthes gracilis]